MAKKTAFTTDEIECVEARVDGADFAHLIIPGIACVELLLKSESAEMARLWVSRKYRRAGIGSLLFRECVRLARQSGKASLCFTVRKDNAQALLFYLAMKCIRAYDYGEEWMMVYSLLGDAR